MVEICCNHDELSSNLISNHISIIKRVFTGFGAYNKIKSGDIDDTKIEIRQKAHLKSN